MGGSLTERPKKHASVVTKPVSQGGNAIQLSEVSSSSNRAGTTGVGEAEEVLDTVSSSKTNLSRVFTLGVGTKRHKISILAFEVANTIVLGAGLMQSLSEESIRQLKEVVLPSERVQSLISRDVDELLIIAAADKREEFDVFSRGVVRFGNYSKDPQWHNLDRYFEKLASAREPQEQSQEKSEMEMQQLITLVQYTVELYHELQSLEKLDEDYQRKLQEPNNLNSTQRVFTNCMGDNLAILRAELNSQRKLVKKLKKKSLWSKNLEEVLEKLVDVVHFLHLRIRETFGSADAVAQDRMRRSVYRCKEIRLNMWKDSDWQVQDSKGNHKELGSAGLALHYANIIAQIDVLTYKSSCVPPKTRDALYQGLPRSIKSRLRTILQSEFMEEITVPQIIAEIEKTLQWLVPMATNTKIAHNSFGWIGEWATTGCEANRKATGKTVLLRVETLHHADKEKTEAYILDLLVWLHHLVSHQARNFYSAITCPTRSPVPLESNPFRALDVIDGLDNFQTS